MLTEESLVAINVLKYASCGGWGFSALIIDNIKIYILAGKRSRGTLALKNSSDDVPAKKPNLRAVYLDTTHLYGPGHRGGWCLCKPVGIDEIMTHCV